MSSPFASDAGKKAGVEVWRIEKLTPVPVAKEQFGNFFSGDSYIILHTYEKFSSLAWNLYFWLGRDSSQDEKGAAALFTITLDDQLGGKPVQFREVQDHESEAFKKVFPNMICMDGGVASGFNRVDLDAYQPRLFQVKGKRNARVTQVALKSSAMNQGDVFILDLGKTLFQWNGKAANKYEKVQGLHVIKRIANDERGGKCTVNIIESGVASEHSAEFFAAVGAESQILSAEAGGSDDHAEQGDAVLLQVTAEGTAEIARGKPERSSLNTEGCFILDSGATVYVWVGKQASKDLRAQALGNGQKYLAEAKRPDFCSVVRVPEGAENADFQGKFAAWNPPRTIQPHAAADASTAKAEVNVDSMLQRAAAEEKEVASDAGSDKVTVWRIENFQKVEVPKETYGHFFSGDSYIVQHAFTKNKKPSWYIYFWQGKHSSADEKGASALLTRQMDDELGGSPVQVRVVMNKEPRSFLKLFQGRFVLHNGGRPSSFRNSKEVESEATGPALFHVKGNDKVDTGAIQVETRASSLNSCDCFILVDDASGALFVWDGSGSNDAEKATALTIATSMSQGRDLRVIAEGAEPAEFWALLGGQAEYPTSKTVNGAPAEPRLFHVTNKRRGFVDVEEVTQFSQDDLLGDDVMILDAENIAFVWIGHESAKEEQDGGFQAALKYLAKREGKPADASPDTPLFRINSGAEPTEFTCFFHGWDSQKAGNRSDKYAEELASLPKAPAPMQRVTQASISAAAHQEFTYEQLVNGQAPGIDATKKHTYLSDAEFEKVFHMKRAEFDALPAWKQTNKRKEVKLF